MTDLSRYVLAEDIDVKTRRTTGNTLIIETTFTALCPNCKRRHRGRAICLRQFSFVSYRLKCGWLKVSTPWADATPPDEDDVFGQLAVKL
jgi:predicted RNA-binding Zn-ribbon protein involved in translation (DUF1610 family)